MTNVFVAKTLRPDSTEDSNVLIAVITPTTEKTPTLIPSKVRIDLNLFCFMARIAIKKLSFVRFLKLLLIKAIHIVMSLSALD